MIAPVSNVEYAVMCRFAHDGGGDVADVFHCGNDALFVSLADIEGSGQEAAAHAAMIKYGIRAHASAGRSPSMVLQRLGTESFAGLFLALVGEDRRTLTYACAGYEAGMLLHRNGFSEALPAQFGQRTIAIAPGTTLIAISDGVTQARLGHKHFGIARVRGLLSERAGAPLEQLTRDIIEAAAAFCRGNITDDMAVLAVRFGLEE